MGDNYKITLLVPKFISLSARYQRITMAARGKKELLILGDRNFDGTEEKLIRTYADGLFHNVKNYTIYRPEDLEEMYGPREGNMRHISHVLVACVTPLMRNPAVMNRGNHSDNVRKYSKWKTFEKYAVH